MSWNQLRLREFRLWRYRELIPLPRGAKIVSLGEGGTPLIEAPRLARELGLGRLYIKFEGANPTGSFKDRGMTVAVTAARVLGVGAVVCASTGNTAASMSAYAARAGLRAVIVLPRGGVAMGKLAQAVVHGAEVVFVDGGFDEALRAVMEAAREGIAYPLNSINPWRIEGQKTLAYEVVDEIGVPDWLVVPVGNAGNISAIWKGFVELRAYGLAERTPRLAGVQAEGAAPLVEAYRLGLERPRFVDSPRTVASAIRIGKPVNWPRAMRAVRESRGVMLAVSDEEIVRAQAMLARTEGIGVELASAAALAGLKAMAEEGMVSRDDTVVVVATGHVLKEPEGYRLHRFRAREVGSAEDAVAVIEELARRP